MTLFICRDVHSAIQLSQSWEELTVVKTLDKTYEVAIHIEDCIVFVLLNIFSLILSQWRIPDRPLLDRARFKSRCTSARRHTSPVEVRPLPPALVQER